MGFEPATEYNNENQRLPLQTVSCCYNDTNGSRLLICRV